MKPLVGSSDVSQTAELLQRKVFDAPVARKVGHQAVDDIESDHTIRYRSKLLTLAGTDSLQYRVCDTAGRCGTATVTITISLL